MKIKGRVVMTLFGGQQTWGMERTRPPDSHCLARAVPSHELAANSVVPIHTLRLLILSIYTLNHT